MGKYSFLKSGTDIRGEAIAYGDKKVTLTDEAVYDIAAAFSVWLSKKVGKPAEELKISVGHDSRLSADRMSNAVIEALTKCGAHVFFFDLASTPAMFMSVVEMNLDGAVQITASHHPFYRNGLKFFTRDGGAEGEDIAEILETASRKAYEDDKRGACEKYDFMPVYAGILRDVIKKGVNAEDYEHPLKGKKIIVDAGNGAGGFYAKDVLQPLGADISGSRFLEPDGHFPNHIPNPEDETAMAFAKKATLDAHADLGVIFDTDVDRSGAVDCFGNEINKNKLIALASVIATEGKKDCYIVTDSVTSDGLADFINNDLSCHHYRFVRGYKNIINEALRLQGEGKDVPLAAETSGHIAFRENYFLDDGAYLITKIIITMALLSKENKTIDDLLKNLKMPVQAKEFRIDIKEKDFKAYGKAVIDRLERYASEMKGWKLADDSREGVRISFNDSDKDGWLLLRLSVHDPVLPVNVESNVSGGVGKIAGLLYEALKSEQGLDLSSLEK